ncbi:MAG: hypothetical protein ACXV5B_08990 [Halobacteriota archaeon]
MKHDRQAFECFNVSNLTFILADKRDIDLAQVRFTRVQERERDSRQGARRESDEAAVCDVRGTLDPKDSDCAYVLLQQALDNTPFSIHGRFKDTRKNDEAEWLLTNLQFDHVSPGRLTDWTFHARASKR